MKKLIGILIGFALFTMAIAQPLVRNSHNMGAGETYYEYKCTAADVVSGRWVVNGLSHDTLGYNILVNRNGPVNVNCRVEVTSRGGSADTYAFTLFGKIFANDAWAVIFALAAQTGSANVTDTIDITRSVRPAKFYRYFQMRVQTDNSCAATDSLVLSKIIWKVYER